LERICADGVIDREEKISSGTAGILDRASVGKKSDEEDTRR
jgi:hypothetical protein